MDGYRLASPRPAGYIPVTSQSSLLHRESPDTFGPDRVIFAADWPVCTIGGTFQQWLDAVKVITKDRAAEECEKLFHDNAIKAYGIQS